MAEFTAGDRVVKMSGIAAGKYGTVNSVREDGTLNVTFDGERMARFCDPERCGKVAANAKFKVGDKIAYSVFGQTKTGTVVEVAEKFHSEYGNEHEGEQTYMVDFGKKPYTKTWESRMTLANSRACNATFKVGDRAWYKEPSTGEKIEITITGVSGSDYEYVTVDGIKGRTVGYSGKGLYPLNSRACNRASVFEYGVGDTVKLRSGRTGEVLSKYVDKNGDIKIDVDLNGTRFTASPEMIDAVVKNSRACNAEITPELKKAYDEWMKAKAKFDKWWNPNRRLSENPPKGADATRKQLDFAAVFKKVTGKLTPNGYGKMTLEQMVDAVS